MRGQYLSPLTAPVHTVIRLYYLEKVSHYGGSTKRAGVKNPERLPWLSFSPGLYHFFELLLISQIQYS